MVAVVEKEPPVEYIEVDNVLAELKYTFQQQRQKFNKMFRQQF